MKRIYINLEDRFTLPLFEGRYETNLGVLKYDWRGFYRRRQGEIVRYTTEVVWWLRIEPHQSAN